jgi:hypothetical protein
MILTNRSESIASHVSMDQPMGILENMDAKSLANIFIEIFNHYNFKAKVLN